MHLQYVCVQEMEIVLYVGISEKETCLERARERERTC